MPLSFIFVSMVIFNNVCLKFLNVSFYFLARSLTTIFNVVSLADNNFDIFFYRFRFVYLNGAQKFFLSSLLYFPLDF